MRNFGKWGLGAVLMAGCSWAVAAAERAPWQLNMHPGVTQTSHEAYQLHMLSLWICVVIGLIALRGMKGVPGPGRYLVWLVTTLGLFMATGYLLFSGVGGIGDLATVTKGLQPAWLWRVLLALAGAALYLLSAIIAAAEFGRIAGPPGEALVPRARRIALVSYLTGAVVICAAGILNPQGFIFVLISAAASTLGGASGLLWMMNMLRSPRFSRPDSAELALPRSWGWIVAAAVVLVVYVVVLGPGIRF